MGKLTTFLYAYLTRKANDSNSSVWLPKTLVRYMPLKKEEPQKIEISAAQKSISTDFLVIYRNTVLNAVKSDDAMKTRVLNEAVISVNREESAPELTLSDISITGMENLQIGSLDKAEPTKDGRGYELVFPVTGPAYGPAEYKDYQRVEVTMGYSLRQHFCGYYKDKAQQKEYILAEDIHVEQYLPGGWPKCDLILHGTMKVSLREDAKNPIVINPDITYTVQSAGDSRKLGAVINGVNLVPDCFSQAMLVDVESLDSEVNIDKETARQFVQKQLNMIPVKTGILQSINSTLNQDGSREKMSGQLTDFTLKAFTNVLVAAPDDLPTTKDQEDNAVDQYIFDRIRYAMCYEDSRYYLPKVIDGWTDPPLNKLQLGTVDISLEQSPSESDGGLTRLVLTNVEMEGLAGLQVALDDIGFSLGHPGKPDTVTMLAYLNLTIGGGLHIPTETGTDDPHFVITLSNCPFRLECVISGEDVDTLNIIVNAAEIKYTGNTIHFEIIEEIMLKGLLEAIVNKDAVLEKLAGKFNDKLSAQDLRERLNESVTKKVRRALSQADI